jgi:hypothetical protein
MYCSGLLPVASAIAAILGPAPSASSAAGGLVASGAGVAEESLDSGTGGAAISVVRRRALILQMAQWFLARSALFRLSYQVSAQEVFSFGGL